MCVGADVCLDACICACVNVLVFCTEFNYWFEILTQIHLGFQDRVFH